LALVALVIAIAGCSASSASPGDSGGGSTDTPSVGGGGNDSPDSPDDGDAGVEVPDVAGEDGADAVSDAESAGLEASLADGTGEDPGFDSSRDPSGCEVTDQDPGAGEPAAEGDELEISLDCRQTDWDNQEGSAWDAYNDAYGSAFDDGCQALFDTSPNGSLYEDDAEYSVVDCQNLNPGDGSGDDGLPGDVPDSPEDVGNELGETAGCRSLFDEEGLGSLNYGTDSTTADDCPIGGAAPSSPSAPPRAHDKPHRSGPRSRKTSDLYRVSRKVWNSYDDQMKLRAAQYFLRNNPRDCGGRGITPKQLVKFADVGGLGDTRGRLISDVMIVLCSDAAAGE
jgi:hypothetical protein